MPHAVLVGDSIFDNASYVPGEPRLSTSFADSSREIGRQRFLRWMATSPPT